MLATNSKYKHRLTRAVVSEDDALKRLQPWLRSVLYLPQRLTDWAGLHYTYIFAKSRERCSVGSLSVAHNLYTIRLVFTISVGKTPIVPQRGRVVA